MNAIAVSEHRSLRSLVKEFAFPLMIVIATGLAGILAAVASSGIPRKNHCAFTVRVTASGEKGQLMVALNHDVRRVPLENEATVEFKCVPLGETVELYAKVNRRSGYTTFLSNGSQYLELELLPNHHGGLALGPYKMRQKPAITFMATSGRHLDVYRNGSSEGTTPFTKGVPAGEQLNLAWKGDAGRAHHIVLCTKAVTLDWDQTRTYSCDPISHRVIEP